PPKSLLFPYTTLFRSAPDEDGHAPCVVREEHGRLTRGVAAADDVDVVPVRGRRLAPRSAVGDALPGKPVEPVDGKLPPRHAAREDRKSTRLNSSHDQI